MLDFDLVARVREDLATEASRLLTSSLDVRNYRGVTYNVASHRIAAEIVANHAICAEACEQAHRAITHVLTQLAEHLDDEQAREALR